MRFDLLLDVVHHRDRSNQNDGRDYLMRVKTGVEETQVMQTAASVCIISK